MVVNAIQGGPSQKAGIKPGDRISVQVEKSKENLFLYLASLNNGLIYHPLNTGYTNDQHKTSGPVYICVSQEMI